VSLGQQKQHNIVQELYQVPSFPSSFSQDDIMVAVVNMYRTKKDVMTSIGYVILAPECTVASALFQVASSQPRTGRHTWKAKPSTSTSTWYLVLYFRYSSYRCRWSDFGTSTSPYIREEETVKVFVIPHDGYSPGTGTRS